MEPRGNSSLGRTLLWGENCVRQNSISETSPAGKALAASTMKNIKTAFTQGMLLSAVVTIMVVSLILHGHSMADGQKYKEIATTVESTIKDDTRNLSNLKTYIQRLEDDDR